MTNAEPFFDCQKTTPKCVKALVYSRLESVEQFDILIDVESAQYALDKCTKKNPANKI